MTSKAQSSVEIIILLTVVLILILIVTYSIGPTTDIPSQQQLIASKAYWENADIAITSITSNGSMVEFTIQNNLRETISIFEMDLDNTSNKLLLELGPGMSTNTYLQTNNTEWKNINIKYLNQKNNQEYSIISNNLISEKGDHNQNNLKIYAPNTIGHWNFNIVNSTYAIDISQNNHGLIIGDPNQINGVMEFDGDGDYIETQIIPIPEKFTYTFWLKTNEDTDVTPWNGILSQGGYSDGIRMLDYSGHILTQLTFGTDTTPTRQVHSPDIDDLEWHHYAITFDKTFIRAYFDGVNYYNQSETQDLKVTPDKLELGRAQYNFNGTLEEIMFYNRALTSNEISHLVNVGRE